MQQHRYLQRSSPNQEAIDIGLSCQFLAVCPIDRTFNRHCNNGNETDENREEQILDISKFIPLILCNHQPQSKQEAKQVKTRSTSGTISSTVAITHKKKKEEEESKLSGPQRCKFTLPLPYGPQSQPNLMAPELGRRQTYNPQLIATPLSKNDRTCAQDTAMLNYWQRLFYREI